MNVTVPFRLSRDLISKRCSTPHSGDTALPLPPDDAKAVCDGYVLGFGDPVHLGILFTFFLIPGCDIV